jgi:hypothetical protein
MSRQDRAGWNWLVTLVLGILIILACGFLLLRGAGFRGTMQHILSGR